MTDPGPRDSGGETSPLTGSTAAVSTATVPVVTGPGETSEEIGPAATGRYELGPRLGAGGMGEILLARDTQIGREVAIKRVRDHASRARFVREARIQGRLDHPAIVPVHELAADESGRPFFAMKRLAGVTLRTVLVRLAAGDAAAAARWPRQRLLRAFIDVCLAVEFAHSRGVVHRDLKPDNVMLGDFGEVWLLDWGVARVTGEDELSASTDSSPPGDATLAGAVLGTPGYIAPEQLGGDPTLDHRADVFALGCILFEILTGQRLLPTTRDPSQFAQLDARATRRAPDRDIAPELEAACVTATAIDRDHRPASARALGDTVERFLDGDRDVSLRRRLADDHLATARAALAGGDTAAARATAMREAGRALALDPARAAAAEVVTGLLLAPPRDVPPEVERELEAIDDDTTVTQNRLAIAAFVAYLAFVPYFAWMGASWPWLVAIAGMAVTSGAIAWIGMTTYPRRSTPLFIASLVINTALIAAMARVCTPFLIAPGIAGATAMSYAINPREGRRTWLLIAAMIAAVFAPWLLEHAGVLSRTMTVVDDALVLRSPVLALELTGVELGLAAFTIVIVVSVGIGVRSIARAQDAARRVQQVQAWHLRQLVTAR